MTEPEKEHWLCNIENTAVAVARELGWETVRFVLREYGNASSIESLSLSPSRYQEVYNALFDYEVGIRD